MATQFSRMTQSERSQYRLAVTRRRLGKSVAWPGAEFGRSCTPSQPAMRQPARVRKSDAFRIIAVDECVQLDSNVQAIDRAARAAVSPAPEVVEVATADVDRHLAARATPQDGIDATEDRAHARAMTEAEPMFVVQVSPDGKGNWVRLGKLRSDTARKLADAAGEHAKAHPGVCVRVIRPTEGARAVLRFRYVQDKLTGAWFLGSYR